MADNGFRDLAALAQVETDRFCAGCGYNLHQQPVRREPKTQLLLCQCPECGMFEPVTRDTTVARLWMTWAIRLGLVLCVAAILFIGWIATVLLYAMIYEYVRMHFQFQWSQLRSMTPRSLEGWMIWQQWFLLIGGAVTGWVLINLATVLLPHWRRWGYALLMAVAVGLAGLVAYLDLSDLCDRYGGGAHWPFILQLMLTMAAVEVAAGLAAVWFGRPFVRLAVRLLVPGRMRAALAYLWHVDGRTPPAVAARPGRGSS